MLKNFDETIQAILRDHGVENDELESALIAVFNQYERRLLSSDFIEEIERRLDRRVMDRNRARGIT